MEHIENVKFGGKRMSLAEAAKRFYKAELQKSLEAKHRDEFVAIEPESKAHFVGASFLEAAMAAKRAYPERKSFVLRIGHDAAFHIGASTK